MSEAVARRMRIWWEGTGGGDTQGRLGKVYLKKIMKVTAIQLKNIRGFRELPKTEFSENINIFIGPNNAWKSTILNVINFLQNKAI